MQLLLDARSNAAVVESETSSGGGGEGYESAGSSVAGLDRSTPRIGHAEALSEGGVDVERHIAMSAQTNAALVRFFTVFHCFFIVFNRFSLFQERHVAEHQHTSSGDSGGAASDLDLGLEDALAAARSTLADMPGTMDEVGGVGTGNGDSGGDAKRLREEGVLVSSCKNAKNGRESSSFRSSLGLLW